MKILLATLSLIFLSTMSYSAETVGEKVEAKTNDAKRSVKSVANRAEEEICDKTDKNCFAKKTQNRASEAKDYVKDKSNEAVNVMDNDEEEMDKKKKQKLKAKKFKSNKNEVRAQQDK